MSEEKLTRGSAINGNFRYIKAKWGVQGLQKCRSDIGLEEELKDGAFYPDEIMEKILKWLAREKGMSYVREAGAYTVQHLGMISWIMRFADIKTIAKRLPKNYDEVYKFGRTEVDTSQENKIVIRLYDVCTYEEAYCTWQGVCEGALAACKTKGRVIPSKCSSIGDPYDEFIIEYE